MEAYTKTTVRRPRISLSFDSTNYTGPSSEVHNYSTYGTTVVCDRVLNGYRNPNWKAQLAQKVQAGTPFSASSYDIVASTPIYFDCEWYTIAPYTWNSHRHWVYGGSQLWDSGVTGISPSGVPGTHAYQTTANNRAIAKLYEALTSFEGTQGTGEDLGELGQTLSLLRSPMKGLISAVNQTIDSFGHALAKSNKARIAKGLCDAALEYKFGMLPLVNSITGVVSGLQNRDYLYNYYPFSVSSSANGATDVTKNCAHCWQVRKLTQTSTSVRYKGEWKATAGVDRRSVNDILGLRFRDIVPNIWNLFPYSWMADYVFNVGTIISGLSVPWGGVSWCVKTVRTVSRETYMTYPDWQTFKSAYANQPTAKFVKQTLIPGTLQIEGKRVDRTLQTDMPIPTLEFDPRGSLGHIFNLSALLGSKLLSHSGLLANAVKQFPDLPSTLNDEFGRRRERIPYPFHKR